MKHKNGSRILALLLTLLMALSVLPTGAFAAGGLEVVDGVAQISSAADLKLISEDYSKYELTKDIDLNDEPWTPLPEFRGSIDGKGYKITGINACVGADEGGFGVFYGLFAKIAGASVKNLGIEGKISLSEADSKKNGIRAGLLAGQASAKLEGGAKIENCHAVMTSATPVSDATKSYLGALVGQLQEGTSLNCYSVSAAAPMFGAIPLFAEVPSSYYDSDFFKGKNPESYGDTLTPQTTEFMQSAEFVDLLNDNRGTNNEWVAVDGGYPQLTAGQAVVKPIPATVEVWGPRGLLMPKTAVEVTSDRSGIATVEQALIAAMKATGDDPDGNSELLTVSGTIKKLYGISANESDWLEAINHEIPEGNTHNQTIAKNDDITIFYVGYVTGYYSWPGGLPREVDAGKPVTLNLQGYKIMEADESKDFDASPIEGATVSVTTADGTPVEEISAVTDAEGNATITIPTKGEYVVASVKENVNAAYCEILVNDRGNADEKLAQVKALADNLATLPEFTDSIFDWQVMDMAAYDKRANLNNKQEFYAQAIATAQQPTTKASTDFERVALSLTAMGHDITKLAVGNGETLDLLSKIANYNATDATPSLGTPNGYLFALLAYDGGDYALPPETYWTRETLIAYLVETRHNDGGWSLSEGKGAPSDPDITAMALSALAPYGAQAEVKAALDGAVAFLSAAYLETGSFGANSNSASTVITALTALGIDPDNDSRFLRRGVSLLDHLLTFKTDDGRFGFTNNTTYNNLATEQGFRALIAYLGFKDAGKAYNVYHFGVPTPDKGPEKVPVTDAPIDKEISADQDADLTTTPTIEGDKKVFTLPKIDVKKAAGDSKIELAIAADTKVTAPAGWDGTISLPKTVSPSVEGKTVTAAVKVGATVDLTFDKPVRLLIPNVSATAKLGFIGADGAFHENIATLTADSAEALDDEKDGKIVVGDGVAVWTRHFTTFVAYTDNVLPPTGEDLTVTVSVTGDAKHGTMLAPTSVTVPGNSKAWAAIKEALEANHLPYVIRDNNNYIASIGGLAEFDNGPNSGWYYYVNGVRPNIGVGEFKIKNSDVIDLVYTDDYVKDYPNWSGDDSKKPTVVTFDDLAGYSWAEKAILDFAGRGLLPGVEEGRFAPEAETSRGEFLSVLVELLELKADFTDHFTDVAPAAACYSAVGIAKALGITSGTGGNLFAPDLAITREDMCTLAYNALGAAGRTLPEGTGKRLSDFTDASAVSPYSAAALETFVRTGLIQGSGNALTPRRPATRAEVAVFLSRLEAAAK